MNQAELAKLNLKQDEYKEICRRMKREPNFVELGIFSVLWSEHCSYKSSKIYLKTLPTKGEHVLQGPGENAGIVDLGKGEALAFKIESHNHPSYVEPFQGAATGVGGILRDIFTMGARPIALLDSIHFGNPDKSKKNSYLFERVVAGISWYGNCIGIPTVGGETKFDDCYSRNPLVNVMTAGLVASDGIRRGVASGVGNPVIYVGSKTGRDGIHGATFASDQLDDQSDSDRPAVQVGDPFSEKLLLEACLELFQTDYVVGIQDMGAAGLTSSSIEMAQRGGVGIRLDLDLVPQREERMSAYEIMLSESQERMLLVGKKGAEKKIAEIFHKWDLNYAVIGEIISKPEVRIQHLGKSAAVIPLAALEAPEYKRPAKPRVKSAAKPLNLVKHSNLQSDFIRLLEQSPGLRYLGDVFHKYDYQVGTNTAVGPGADTSVLRLKGGKRAVALNLESNGRLCYLNPFEGTKAVLSEAVINQACMGASPLGLTNCLNFGSPEKPEIMWEFAEVIRGMRDTCNFFKIPVTGGNVSFYNDYSENSIYPTPVFGLAGLINDCSVLPVIQEGYLYLAGESSSLAGSAFLKCFPQPDPDFQVDLEKIQNLQKFILSSYDKGLLTAAHDIAEGGLFFSLLESVALRKKIGVDITLPEGFSVCDIYAELPGKALLIVKPDKRKSFEKAAGSVDFPVNLIGKVVGKEQFSINGEKWDFRRLKDLYFRKCPRLKCFLTK
ncbi:MAG: phosphoribosylformylglycinamidine synthase subunit PurL [Candidatus Wallbacteria bacterium]|nr:phosphoribosylformylglycinamidine synthase subunit PurL [Candidatus Wallbacteria bacterium]